MRPVNKAMVRKPIRQPEEDIVKSDRAMLTETAGTLRLVKRLYCQTVTGSTVWIAGSCYLQDLPVQLLL